MSVAFFFFTLLQTPIHSPPQIFPDSSKGNSQPLNGEQEDSSDENEATDQGKKRIKSSARRDSYSDSSGSGGEEPTANTAQIANTRWTSALYQTSSKSTARAHSPYEISCSQEEAIRTIYYSPHELSRKVELEERYVSLSNIVFSAVAYFIVLLSLRKENED